MYGMGAGSRKPESKETRKLGVREQGVWEQEQVGKCVMLGVRKQGAREQEQVGKCVMLVVREQGAWEQERVMLGVRTT
jgi:hypothetical protein